MSSRSDLDALKTLDVDLSALGLAEIGVAQGPYFCTPENAEYVARLGCDGVHFILLPGDERVFCVEPSMGDIGTYVLPVAEDLRQFLDFVLYCRDANPLSQIFWMEEGQFRALLADDQSADWPGRDALMTRKEAACSALSAAFGLTGADPFAAVKALQAAFDPAVLVFSDEYYDTLGLERE